MRAMGSGPTVSTPEEVQDAALCSMCRSETPPDDIFFGVCLECLGGHVCVPETEAEEGKAETQDKKIHQRRQWKLVMM